MCISRPKCSEIIKIFAVVLKEYKPGSKHRTIAWFELERAFKDRLSQSSCHGPGHLPLDQVAQSPTQPGLEHFQGGGSHNFSGQPVPEPYHPHRKKFLPYVQSKPTRVSVQPLKTRLLRVQDNAR